jgi:hypothetical protein
LLASRAGVLLPVVVPPIRDLLTVPTAKAPPPPGQARVAPLQRCSARAHHSRFAARALLLSPAAALTSRPLRRAGG